MARPREFDEATVLDAAIQCFWDKGFEATSMRDLTERMRMTAASLYNAFGDKKALFRRALDHYVDCNFAERARRLGGSGPPRQIIAAYFDEVIERSLDDPLRKGCMVINSAMDVAPHDPEMQAAVVEILGRIEDFFRRTIEAGQAEGSISGRYPAVDLARMLLGVLTGLRVLTRARPERELLEGMVRPVLSLLAPPSTEERPKDG
jgi:TetR/AcrR family transcriptional repressor of nem operon